MRIPKEIREKIELRKQLNQELDDWFEEHIDTAGCDTRDVCIVDEPTGAYQGDGEWCEQHQGHTKDEYYGYHYYKMDNDKFLRLEFWV